MADLPRKFHALKPHEIEDVLCIFELLYPDPFYCVMMLILMQFKVSIAFCSDILYGINHEE